MITKDKLKWLAQNGAKLIDPDNDSSPDTPELVQRFKGKYFFELPDGMLYSYDYINDTSIQEIKEHHALHYE